MLCKTRAIVLKVIKYSESSLVAKMYTEQAGLKSFLVRSVRKRRPVNSPNLFQPLSIIEVVFLNKETGGLIIPKEITSAHHFGSIPFDVGKGSMILFLNELIYRSIREEEANPEFFAFLVHSIIFLDTTTEKTANAHIIFALQLTRFLGFFPLGNFAPERPYFLLRDGVFGKFLPDNDFYLKQHEAQLWDVLLKTKLEESHLLQLSSAKRKRLLEIIILYYQLHLIGFGEIKSLEILIQLFHD
ncbi:MAG: DNA repair protein RecO [Bacteroidota bacterium]